MTMEMIKRKSPYIFKLDAHEDSDVYFFTKVTRRMVQIRSYYYDIEFYFKLNRIFYRESIHSKLRINQSYITQALLEKAIELKKRIKIIPNTPSVNKKR